jgi:hypothetical protein
MPKAATLGLDCVGAAIAPDNVVDVAAEVLLQVVDDLPALGAQVIEALPHPLFCERAFEPAKRFIAAPVHLAIQEPGKAGECPDGDSAASIERSPVLHGGDHEDPDHREVNHQQRQGLGEAESPTRLAIAAGKVSLHDPEAAGDAKYDQGQKHRTADEVAAEYENDRKQGERRRTHDFPSAEPHGLHLLRDCQDFKLARALPPKRSDWLRQARTALGVVPGHAGAEERQVDRYADCAMAVIDRDIDWVLVTGAGASRPFGLNDTRLPLMDDWAAALVKKLVSGPSGYLGMTGLAGGLASIEFEEQLGRFLNQVTAFAQVKDVVSVSKHLLAPEQAALISADGGLESWYENTKHHLSQIVDLIHESLYEQFAEPGWDPARARDAYIDLFQTLGINASSRWVYATTNYDRIGETAVELADLLPDWGEPSRTGNGERPIQVDRLLEGIPRYVPVLHLHGRVGWYRRLDVGGAPAVYSTTATRHQPGFGVPIVMLPDPAKAYDSDPVINSLWTQFVQSLRRARRVFVLGHSLNDRALLNALRDNVHTLGSIAVTVLASDSNPEQPNESSTSVAEKVKAELGSAALIPMRFGEPGSGRAAIEDWLQREQAKES